MSLHNTMSHHPPTDALGKLLTPTSPSQLYRLSCLLTNKKCVSPQPHTRSWVERLFISNHCALLTSGTSACHL